VRGPKVMSRDVVLSALLGIILQDWIPYTPEVFISPLTDPSNKLQQSHLISEYHPFCINHQVFEMSSEDEVRRNIVKRSSIEEANRIYQNITQQSTVNGGLITPPGQPYPFFVPSTVKSTLGSPVCIIVYLPVSNWLTSPDCISHWGFCDYFDDFVIEFDGMARCNNYKCLYWKFLLW